jgi:two-component system, chemotaxis family, protein-glutamate methylesterase/glutaminase
MAKRNLVVIGASAGGIEALQFLLNRLPESFDAPILIVLHTSNHAGSLLPQILQRAGPLPVLHPSDGTLIEKGRVYVAPPNFHMIVEGDMIRVIKGPRENLHRPAIDPLFRSAAASFGQRAIGVILTGLLDDGTSGLMVIRTQGGEAVIQDPDDALFSAMPKSALEQVPDAHVLPLSEIPDLLMRLVNEEVPERVSSKTPQTRDAVKETRISELNMSEIANEDRVGRPSPFGCPDCGGVLWEIEENGFLRFRCRVGHAYTARHLDAEQRHGVETALWAALRALEESASLYRRMAERAGKSSHDMAAEQFESRASNTDANARILKEFLLNVNRIEDNQVSLED